MLKFFGCTANHKYPLMRQPDQLPRCYELTEHERLQKVKEWNNRNIWNTPELAEEDETNFYQGA
jgi:hypothetical protein